MGFINDDKAEVIDGGKKSGTGTDNYLRGRIVQNFCPELVASGFGLARMEESDVLWESLLKNGDKLRSEGNFRNEQDDGLVVFEGFGGESKVNVGFAGASDTMEEFGGGRNGSNVL